MRWIIVTEIGRAKSREREKISEVAKAEGRIMKENISVFITLTIYKKITKV
ncbi:hypothetical protein [Leptospira interrogans]|uniref:hypothetical protein n=1 Tax=Leptospira interrogans TaxID=173 RepID=UPI00188AB26D|nr:hypothetical protein [Leptospira interrogans]MBF3368152.1 hypothetical protein [Leptospira interrogans serovar Pomona]